MTPRRGRAGLAAAGPGLGPSGATAREGLRTYWGTAVLLAAAGTAAVAVLAPVFALASAGAAGRGGLALPGVGGLDLGLVWGSLARSPDALRRAAVAGLARLVVGVGLGVLAVTWLTTLSLSLARGAARAPEMTVRRAAGATRLQLLGAATLEGAAVALAALVVGGALGLLGTRLALGAWPGTGTPATPAAVLGVAGTLAGIGLGAVLTLVLPRRRASLAAAEATPLVLVLPALQLGLSVTVLAAGSLLAGGRRHMTADAPRTGDVWRLDLRPGPAAPRAAAYAALLRDLDRVGGAGPVSLASPGTTVGLGPVDVVLTDCGTCWWGGLPLPWHTPLAAHYLASPDTFRALGLTVIAGRVFTEGDAWGTAAVAVISRSLAEQDYEAAGAVGRKILVGRGSDSLATVIGVVADRRPAAFGGGLEPAKAVYLSVLQHPAAAVELTLPGGGTAATRDAVRSALRRDLRDRLARVERVSAASLLGAEAAPLRWFGRMFSAAGGAMLGIAALGTFAVMWLWVGSLAADLGLRRAVGGTARRVLGHVMGRAALVAAGGVAFALWVGLMLWDAVRLAVAGMPAWDPLAVARYGGVLVAAALAGALLPAWRLMHAAPARLLSGPV